MEFQNIRDIAIYGGAFMVDVTRGEDDVCLFVSAKEKYFSVQAENGILTVTQKSNNPLYKILLRKLEFKLVLPKNFCGRLRFRNKNGGIYISGGTFGELDLSVANGKVNVEGLSCSEFSLRMKNGSIGLKSVNCSGEAAIRCSNGVIRAETVTAPTFLMSCRNAALSAIDIKTNRLDCSTDNGTIDASGINTSDARLETANGKIGALFIGERDDYRLSAETSHGSITINGTPSKSFSEPVGSKKRIRSRTSNGDIDIKFM